MSAFVLDASVALAYLLNEQEFRGEARALIERARVAPARVPQLWSAEVVNALVMNERRNRLQPIEVDLLLDLVARFPIEVDFTADVVGDVSPIARRCRLTMYDAMYLELAHRLHLPIATFDRELASAAKTFDLPELHGTGES